jgi:predicted GTPase
MLMADIAIINKVDSAEPKNIERLRRTIKTHNPAAEIVTAESALLIGDPERVAGQRVLVVEDGPTLTHGDMHFGAGMIAAQRWGALEVVDPRPYLEGSLIEAFAQYPHLTNVLPAMGYSPQQIGDLERTIHNTDCDVVLVATPINLAKLIVIDKPVVRVRYEYKDHEKPSLEDVLSARLEDL